MFLLHMWVVPVMMICKILQQQLLRVRRRKKSLLFFIFEFVSDHCFIIFTVNIYVYEIHDGEEQTRVAHVPISLYSRSGMWFRLFLLKWRQHCTNTFNKQKGQWYRNSVWNEPYRKTFETKQTKGRQESSSSSSSSREGEVKKKKEVEWNRWCVPAKIGGRVHIIPRP